MSAREVLARLKCREAYVASGGWSAIEDHVENAWSYYLPNADRDIAALRADGYELVPTKPTVDMLNAAVDVDSYKLGDISPLGFRCGPQQLFERCWNAMLAVAISAAKEQP